MFESLNWPFEITTIPSYSNQFPTLYPNPSSVLTELICVKGHVLPLLHKMVLGDEVYDFSKFENKILENSDQATKGSPTKRVDPLTNPLKLEVTL